MARRRKKHRPEEVVAKLRDADAMLNAGNDLASDGDVLVVTELTLFYGGRPELAIDDTDHWDELMDLRAGHCEKWGPSIAVKIGGQ